MKHVKREELGTCENFEIQLDVMTLKNWRKGGKREREKDRESKSRE